MAAWHQGAHIHFKGDSVYVYVCVRVCTLSVYSIYLPLSDVLSTLPHLRGGAGGLSMKQPHDLRTLISSATAAVAESAAGKASNFQQGI